MGACFSACAPPPASPTAAARSAAPTASAPRAAKSVPDDKPLAPSDWPASAGDVLPACEPIRLLGEGTFGTVILMRERATQQLFAVKVMNKAHLALENQLENIVRERQVLREAGPHPFVVECHSGFQTPDAVVLVLEYVPGGDMYDLMRRHGCLSDADARFYLAEIVVAVAELHRHDFVFRDLKLENILIDSKGHVRLTDFGLAGKFQSGDAAERAIFDISGTAIYQAPEMLAGKGHGRVVDWWALGVLAYVLLAGRPPFSSDSTREELHRRILSEDLDLDKDERLSHVAAEGKDFILRLLDKDPATRLGSAGADARDVQSHPFFDGLDWDAVARAELDPPLAPGIQASAADEDEKSRREQVKIATHKLADKVSRKHKGGRAAKRHLDDGEYKMVKVPRPVASSRVSIGLDFAGKNQTAAAKTWVGTADDFGRVL